ncbi:MAG: hypothetical protein DRG87_09910 [Deltaproteobacteria bacterium]|nr:MAG: hypothetical protein DRG87_09910 [Deltaproteobacteria bacterium]
MKKEQIKPFVWGMAVGSVVLLIVVFLARWVVTSSSAQDTAEELAQNAVIDRSAPISVALFLQDPNREERLKEMKKIDSWKRGSFIEDQGWPPCPVRRSPIAGLPERLPLGLWSSNCRDLFVIIRAVAQDSAWSA